MECRSEVRSEEDVNNARTYQAISTWYDSWQPWQKRILITGIVSRYDRFQLPRLLLAVESVFHKDFLTKAKNIYPNLRTDGKQSDSKPENTFITPSKDDKEFEKIIADRAKHHKPTSQMDFFPHSSLEVSRVPSPRVSRTRTTSGSDTSRPLSPIEETDTASIDKEKEETSPSISTDSSSDALLSAKSVAEDTNSVIQEKWIQRSIPKSVVKRTTKRSALANRPVPSIVSLTPIGAASSVTLDFRSSMNSLELNTEDFFGCKGQETLGLPVTTKSKMDQDEYDVGRNTLPIPTAQQLYKNKKLWSNKTVKPDVERLKEQFREQLTQIWKWIDGWPAHRKTRLLMQLFSNSPHNLIQFAAECVKQKTEEANKAPPEIDSLSDNLLCNIFDRLPSSDLLRASFTCKHWNLLLSNDELWQKRCNELGELYDIQNLAGVLACGAKSNQALDWRQAFIEIKKYLKENMQPMQEEQQPEEPQEEESQEAEEEEMQFPNYIPYWKLLQNRRNSSLRKSVISEEFTHPQDTFQEDLKEDLDLTDAKSDACIEVDMFVDLQDWKEVGELSSIGQKFSVDYHVEEAKNACNEHWSIYKHVLPVKSVEVLKGHTGAVNVVKAQGARVFTAGSDRCIRVWDNNGECFAKMNQHMRGGINDISIGDADGPNILYTASWDMSISIWNTITFKPIATLSGHEGSVQKVAADGKFIVSCSHDGSLKVWNRKTYKLERSIFCHGGAVQCMIFHKKMIISGGDDRWIKMSSVITGKVVRTFVGHKHPVTALKKQQDLLASGDAEGHIFFWSLANGEKTPLKSIKGHESRINAIYMHGRTFFTASNDALVKEWDLVTMTTVRILQGHTDAVTDVQWTKDFLVTAGKDNEVRRWRWRKLSEAGDVLIANPAQF